VKEYEPFIYLMAKFASIYIVKWDSSQ